MDSSNSNFITPPPGLFPNAPAPETTPTETQSGTHHYVRPDTTPRPPAQPPAFFPAPFGIPPLAPSLTLEGEDGRRHVITSLAVFGRNPSATGEWAGAVVIAVEDPAKSVSKTHAGLRVTAAGSSLVDLGSTNGTEIMRLDGTEESLVAGVPVALHPGEVVLIGSRSLRVIA